jgi:hypothetical protein
MGKKPAAKAAETSKTKPTKATKSVEKKVSVKSTKTADLAAKPAGKSCKIASCQREYRAKGYCETHYRKWKQGAYGLARYKTCGDLDCRKPMVRNRHGYCEDHYQNYYVKGMAVAKAAPAEKAPAEKKEAAG